MAKLKIGDLVVVEWIDAMIYDPPKPGRICDPPGASTAGWLVRDDAVCVAVASEVFGPHEELGGCQRGVTVVPRGIVTRVRACA